MADSRAFVKFIGPVGTNDSEHNAVHQTAPAWVLTFVRWENRDTYRVINAPLTEVRDPLVVENDCIQLSVSVSKGSLTPSFQATLVMTDVNYSTEIAPGDFAVVNMLNWESEARRVGNLARSKQAINGQNDGFKGIFKVQGVRRVVSVDPNTGTKIVLFKINGFAFTEYNNTIYFNPYLLDANQDKKNALLFASFLGNDWTQLVNEKGQTNVQDIIAVLIQSFIGAGISDEGRLDKNGIVKSPNVHFYIPSLVGKLLGVSGAKAAKDIYVHLFGIQKYAGGSSESTVLSAGLNPAGLVQKWERIYYTSTPCSGDSLLKPEYWNQVKAWSIINQYTNSPLNELYTCFRVSPNGRVMPTVVFRQIPFTTEDYKGPGAVTKFMNLPRWKISTALITELDIGRDEAARINFVQYYGRSSLTNNGSDISEETAKINYSYDVQDVQRSGLRPYVVTTQFDEPTDKYKDYKSPMWSKIVGDALIGGHLKLNGQITCIGIVDPIAVGDNLELDGVVYHIEDISHVCNIAVQTGNRAFRTTISVSSGISKSSNQNGTHYAEMSQTRAYKERERDFERAQILPGSSDEQDVVYRPFVKSSVPGPAPTKKELNQPNRPFPQPGDPPRKGKRGNEQE